MVIKCPECNHYVSDTVSVCPHCGFDLNSEESTSSNNQEEFTPEVENQEQSIEENVSQDSVVYDVDYYVEKKSNSKKLIIPIVLGCIIIFGIVIGLLYNNAPEENTETPVIETEREVEVVDTIVEDSEPDVSFAVTPIKYGRETDDIVTSISMDFPQTDNEVLQNNMVSFIINALTDDFTYGENQRPSYHGDLTDGQAIAEFFVNDKVREITEAREEDSIESMPWYEEISINRVCETDRLVSYEVDFGGSHGGVGDGVNYGVTFSKYDGTIIRVIAHPSDSKLKSFLIKYIKTYLDSDNQEMIFDEEFYKHPFPRKDPFITDKGIRFVYQKYEMAAGAAGVIDVTIPFSEIADYMSEEALSLIGYEKNQY